MGGAGQGELFGVRTGLLTANPGITSESHKRSNNRNKADRTFVRYMDKIPEKYAFCLCVLNIGLLLIFPTFNGDMDIKIFLNYKKSPEQA